MFRSRTVLVLGAGASAEVGLPVGTGLLADIVARLNLEWGSGGAPDNGDRGIYNALLEHLYGNQITSELNRHISAGLQIRASATQALSIDYIIDALEDPAIELMGKLAIASSILHAEGESRYFSTVGRNEDIDLHQFDTTWYNHLTKLLTEGVRKSEAARIFDNLEIITFNYDRCLERYLPISLASYFGDPPERFQEIVATSLRIHRPFGSVGKLSWEKRLAPSLRFGETSHSRLIDAAAEIRTFTEQMDDALALKALRDAVEEAERVIFLGFAFHRQNLELMTPVPRAYSSDPNKLALATAMGISPSDQAVIRDEIGDAVGISGAARQFYIHLSDMTCCRFFQEHWRTLTA